jgi:flavin reductase (DIM6/NTAB) family NADH-FMN oxidoreductase RutF
MKKFPLKKAFTFIEPGPVVMITTFDGKKNNIMTISWNMVLDFTPQFAILTGPWNHSYKALVKTEECVISIPSVAISQKVIKIGACSGKDTDKFKKFNLTALKAKYVKAPLIKESLANIECLVTDHIKKHNIFVLDGISAWFNDKLKEKRMFHAAGDGTFTIEGRRINHKKLMLNKLPDGV